jgi:HSP20 family molecular chaperone IbpA
MTTPQKAQHKKEKIQVLSLAIERYSKQLDAHRYKTNSDYHLFSLGIYCKKDLLSNDMKEFEFGFSESYFGVGSKIVREEVDVILYDSYPVNLSSNKETRVRKIRRNVKPVSVQGHVDNTTGSSLTGRLSGIEKLDRDSSEDVIITDKNIKVVSQLPINNKKENIKVVAHDDNSMTISHLNSEGKRCTRTSVIPYDIDFETSKATYKNGILEITFNRK